MPGSEGAKLFKISGISFSDADHGYAAARASDEDTGRVLGTTNGGVAWAKQRVVADSGVRDLLFLTADEGWVLTNAQRFADMERRGMLAHPRGGHGYDNQLPSMRAIFIAHGEAVKKGKVVDAFENVQVYNMMCAILGLKPAPNDGNMEAARAVLKETRSAGR